MKIKIVFVFLIFIIILMNNIVANESVYSNIKIESPVSIILDSNYTVIPNSIIKLSEGPLSVIGGEAVVFKYIITNKLDYDLNVDFVISINKELDKKNYRVIILDTKDESECPLGNILYYNNKKIIIKEKNNKIMCYSNKNYDLKNNNLKINMLLNPGIKEQYLLFITTPNIKPENYIFKPNVYILDNNKFTDFNKDYNNFSFGIVKTDILDEEPNYTEDYMQKKQINEEDINKNIQEYKNVGSDIVEFKHKNINNGRATGYINLGISNLLLIIAGLLMVIAFATVISKKKTKRLSDV